MECEDINLNDFEIDKLIELEVYDAKTEELIFFRDYNKVTVIKKMGNDKK